MKIRLSRDVMANAVSWVARSLPNRPSLPVLSGVMIETTGEKVTFSGFDNDTCAEITVPAKVSDEGKVLVFGRLLNDITKSLPNQPVELTTTDSTAELVCGSARFTLQTLPVTEYPELPKMPAISGTVETKDFATAVSQVFVAAGKDELLPVFTGVRVEIAGDKVTMLTTDRYRMALKELTWTPTDTSFEAAALVPAKVLNEVAKSMVGAEEISIALANAEASEQIIGFEADINEINYRLTTRLLTGDFPKVRHVMAIQPRMSVRVRISDLIPSVKRMALVAERNTPLAMFFDEDHLILESGTRDQAQGSESVSAVIEKLTTEEENPLTAAGFNAGYLADVLGVLGTEYVHIAFNAPAKPCLVSGLTDLDGQVEEDYKHVIMLMRLQH